jgi:hypothetical protein
MKTSLIILILVLDTKLQLLETRTCGILNLEKSYSSKGRLTTFVMFHLSSHPNPSFFLQYQMVDNSPQRTRSVGLFLRDRKYECIYGHCSESCYLR